MASPEPLLGEAAALERINVARDCVARLSLRRLRDALGRRSTRVVSSRNRYVFLSPELNWHSIDVSRETFFRENSLNPGSYKFGDRQIEPILCTA